MSQSTGKTTPTSAKVASPAKPAPAKVETAKPSESAASKQEVPAVQAEGQPLGVNSAPNVENPGRELPLVETEEERTKAQMKKTQEDAEKEKAAQLEADNAAKSEDDWDDTDGDQPFFGNQDKKESTEIPGTFDHNAQGYVIVSQHIERMVDGTKVTFEHPIKIQAYNEQVFNKLATPNEDGMTQFKQQGIKYTILHDTRSAKSQKNFK